MDPVRLACVRHAASVRPEPGSNSPSRSRSRPASRPDLRSVGTSTAAGWPRWTASTGGYPRTLVIDVTTSPARRPAVARTGVLRPLFRCQGAHAREHTHRAEVLSSALPGTSVQGLPRGGESLYRRPNGASTSGRLDFHEMVGGATLAKQQVAAVEQLARRHSLI